MQDRPQDKRRRAPQSLRSLAQDGCTTRRSLNRSREQPRESSQAVALGGAWGEAIDGTFGRVGVYFFCSALNCHPNVRSLERSHHRPSAAISGAWRRAPWRSQRCCSFHATSTRSRLSILCSFGMMLRRVNIFAPHAGIGHKRENPSASTSRRDTNRHCSREDSLGNYSASSSWKPSTAMLAMTLFIVSPPLHSVRLEANGPVSAF